MDVTKLVERYADMLYRLCIVTLQSHADAEDAVQETLLRLLTKAPDFENEEHRKAWLITVALNQCRSMQRQRIRTVPTDPEQLHPPGASQEENRLLSALLQLPEKYRTALHLYYVEGYAVGEIAQITGASASAVKMRLARGRRLLETMYRREIGV